MFNYEIGGNEKKIDTSEAFGEISHNKTLFVQQLTENEPLRPEKVEGLRTVEDVFEHFKPSVSVAMDKQDGSTITEKLKFENLGDFGVKQFVQQSDYLHRLNMERDIYLNIIKQ